MLTTTVFHSFRGSYSLTEISIFRKDGTTPFLIVNFHNSVDNKCPDFVSDNMMQVLTQCSENAKTSS